MRITEFQIDQYGPLPRIEHSCDDGCFEVFYGPNESGKTLIIEALLKLMAPNIGDAASGVDRVSTSPTGYVMVETPQGKQKLGDGTSLTDLDAVTPRHLENVFVIRDSSLRIPGEHDYYGSVTEQIGDLHTSEIEAIREQLVKEGNLTPGQLNLEGRGTPKTKAVFRKANSLLSDITTYIENAERENLDAAEQRRLEIERELRDAEQRLSRLEDARRLDQHRTLNDRLEEYRTAMAELQETVVSEENLSTLQERKRDIDRLSKEIDSKEAEIEERKDRIQSLESNLKEVKATIEPLAARESDVSTLESTIADYRAAHEDAIGAGSLIRPMAAGSLLCLGFGGAAAVVGSATLGAVLLVMGFVLGLLGYVQHYRQSRAIREEQRVLNRAGDAGFSVQNVNDISPEIREFKDDLQKKRSRQDNLEQNLNVEEDRLEDDREDLAEKEAELSEAKEQRDNLLQEAGVASVEEYEQLVEKKQTHISNRNSAARSLSDSFGEPAEDDVSPEAKITYWEEELAALTENVDVEDVSADEYDDQEYSNLEERIDKLNEELDSLEEKLENHEQRLQDFASRVTSISAQPYMDEPLSLSVETVDGLREVTNRLEDLVEVIQLSADVSKEAISIFDGLKKEEEQKIATLFEDGVATQVFTRITDGRYEDVEYNTDEQVLEVTRDNGRVLVPDELSKGTSDQLYLATRVSLGRQLLSSQEGFFIMDDAFLPADEQRLTEGFNVLQELAAQDWQILYFTAKSEISDGVVAETGIPCKELDPLP